MSRAETAKEYFTQGYACSQAVALAFADVCGVDKETLTKITLPFGGGMGRLRLTCGAVSGMAAMVGLFFSKAENNPENKRETYAIVQQLCNRFKEQTGSLICGELLSSMNLPVEVGGSAEPRTPQYYQKRSCAEMVYLATRILEEYLTERGIL